MKKKKYLIIVIIVLSGLLIFIFSNHTIAKVKGNIVFGMEKCEGHRKIELVGWAHTEWKCKICGYQGDSSSTDVPEICSECALKTDRCSKCGKKEIEEGN